MSLLPGIQHHPTLLRPQSLPIATLMTHRRATSQTASPMLSRRLPPMSDPSALLEPGHQYRPCLILGPVLLFQKSTPSLSMRRCPTSTINSRTWPNSSTVSQSSLPLTLLNGNDCDALRNNLAGLSPNTTTSWTLLTKKALPHLKGKCRPPLTLESLLIQRSLQRPSYGQLPYQLPNPGTSILRTIARRASCFFLQAHLLGQLRGAIAAF